MKLLKIMTLAMGLLLIQSCSDDDSSQNLLERIEISLSAQNAVPGIPGRFETGSVVLELFGDNTLEFSIDIENLSSSDNLTAAHIHIGDILSTGGVLVGLVDGQTIAFDGGFASGTIELTNEQASTLIAKENLYINVHSVEAPPGLVRGQIGVDIDQAYNVMMSSTVAGRNETGLGYIRVVGDMMYYKLVVNDLIASDQVVASHIHEGATGVDGGVLVGFAIESNDDLDLVKSIELTSEQKTKLSEDDLYINVHSAEEQPGLIRGQIRG